MNRQPPFGIICFFLNFFQASKLPANPSIISRNDGVCKGLKPMKILSMDPKFPQQKGDLLASQQANPRQLRFY